MSVVVSFEDYRPPARFDTLPWTDVRIQESPTEDGTYTEIDSIPLNPVDADPTEPASRAFTTQQGTAVNYWYRIVFVDADGDVSSPSLPVQNVSDSVPVNAAPFVEASELARILTVNEAQNAEALERVLSAAAGEICTEVGRTDFSGWELDLVAQVNLARAEELWRQMKVPWGIVMDTTGVGGTGYIAKDTFARHAVTLQPLKDDWGIA